MDGQDRIAGAGFFDDVEKAYREALQVAGVEVEHVITIAAQRLKLQFAGPSLVDQVMPALAHLEGGRPEVGGPSVRIWDAASTGVAPPSVPWNTNLGEESGELRVRIDERVWGVFDHSSSAMTVVDERSKRAYVHAPGAELPWQHRAAPLRSALHWLLMAPDRSLVHAAAVGTNGGGALLVGKGGSGKTTLALACVEAGVDYVGDDYVLLSMEDRPHAYSVFATARVTADSLTRLPGFHDCVACRGLPGDEKAVLDLRARSDRVREAVPISAVVVPHLKAEGASQLRSVTAATALLAMGPSTIFQHPGRDAQTMRMMAELVRNVPCFTLDVGLDPAPAAAAIARLLDTAH